MIGRLHVNQCESFSQVLNELQLNNRAVQGFARNLSKEINFASKYSVHFKIAVSSDETPYSLVDEYKLF
jgi:hypothetical protein